MGFVRKLDEDVDTDEDGFFYVCIGYDFYIIREFCVMCVMVLVYFRV